MKKKAEKIEQGKELKLELASVSTVILSTFQGITVEQDSKMRREVEAAGGTYQVLKNRVAQHALEGTPTGTFNEGTMVNGLPLTDEEQMQLALKWGGLEAWGTEMMYPHYSTAWAWAGNTPFRWGKQVASHLGGTRNPLVIRWPARMRSSSG